MSNSCEGSSMDSLGNVVSTRHFAIGMEWRLTKKILLPASCSGLTYVGRILLTGGAVFCHKKF